MAFIKGNNVANATSYELLENKNELIDFSKPTNIPAGYWAKDEANNTYVMTNADYANLRWDFELEGGVTYLFSYTFSELNGRAQATMRSPSNATLFTLSAIIDGTNSHYEAGTYSHEYAPAESGTYSFRICGLGETNSGILTNASVSVVGATDNYVPLTTVNGTLNFDLSTLNLATGAHMLVVKAKADGYEDSDYSNTVTYTV